MEKLVQDPSGTLQEPWNPDIVAYVGQNIYEAVNCMQAWKVIPTTGLVSALDAVRNRVLNFVLEIEVESPDAGEAAVNSNPIPQDKVHQIFNTYITGDVQNIATGSSRVKQKVVNKPEKNELFTNLLSVINNANGDREAIAELTGIVEEMRAVQGTETFTTHYQKFMSVLSNHMQILGPVVAPFLPTFINSLIEEPGGTQPHTTLQATLQAGTHRAVHQDYRAVAG